MVLDVGMIANWAAAVATIGFILGWIYKKTVKELITLKIDVNEHDIVIKDIMSEMEILLRAQKAALEAVSGKQCNGNVDKSIIEIDEYLFKKTHQI